jgi:predicted RNA binding protein YcfA (HicA-like mRNA interferase family)
MSSWKTTREKLRLGASDANLDFEGVFTMLRHLGFSERQRGSHRIFYKEGVAEIINLQPRGREGKPYQMKQIRQIPVKVLPDWRMK